MHKSKLSGFIIDCRTGDLPAAAGFWSAALGMPVRELPGAEGDLYRRLEDTHHGLDIEVQRVEHESRVHLDIETDDIEAEVRRLEKLGAKSRRDFGGSVTAKGRPAGAAFAEMVKEQNAAMMFLRQPGELFEQSKSFRGLMEIRT